MILTEDQAREVWKIIAATCGADNYSLDQFVFHSGRTDRLEFRFCGKLGFGGKVYVEEPPRVSCYPEDETPKRAGMIAKTNSQLCSLWEKWNEDA